MFRIIIILCFDIFLLNNLFGQVPPGIPGDNELFKKGFLDVTLLGADSTGTDISTQPIRNAVNLARDYNLVCYFPSGTYLVDDTILCMKKSKLQGTNWVEDKRFCVLVGNSNKRPLIKLVPGAPKFQNSANPLPVFWFYSMTYSAGGKVIQPECAGSTDPNCNQSNINYNCSFRSIDLDLGNNPGAAGVRQPGAQGATIEDVKINATGAFAGIYNPPGQAGGTYNLEVEGGKYGIYIAKEGTTTQRYQAKFTILSGCVFKNQETAVFLVDMPFPMVIVGFHIVKSAGPININLPNNGLSMIDGVIELGGGQVISGTGKSIYMENVYIKGATSVTSDLNISNPNSWTRIEEYSLCGAGSSNLVNGIPNTNTYSELTANIEASSDTLAKNLIMKHIWTNAQFAHFEDADVVNVMDASKMNGFPATGDGNTDDIAALEYAIAHYDKIFLPKGTYKISRTLNLAKNTRIFGTHRTYTSISGAGIQSPNDPEAAPSLAFLSARGGTITWKAGKNSFVRSINPGTIRISENGGGRWAACSNVGSQTFINGTTQPLNMYGTNPERANDPQMEIRNASNVRVFYVKTEAAPENQAAGNTTVRIIGSENVRIYGSTGNVNLLGTNKGMFEVENSNDVSVIHVASFNTGTDWYHIKETYSGLTSGIVATSKLALFTRAASSLAVSNQNTGGLEIYPNPCKNRIHILGNDNLLFSEYRISDLKGNIVGAGKLPSPESSLHLDLAQGMYFISINGPEKVLKRKFIIQ